MSTSPTDIAAQVQEAYRLYLQGRRDAAAALCQQILQHTPRNFGALHLLGILHLERGDNADAESLLRHALAIEPRDAMALSNHGLALRNLRRWEEALLCFDKALRLDPAAATHCNRALVLGDLGRHEEALAGFDRALSLKPDYVEAHAERATTLACLERDEEAFAAFATALSLNSNDPRIFHNRGDMLMKRGDYAGACNDYKRAIALQPTMAEPHAALGLCLLVHGDYRAGWPEYEWRWSTLELKETQRALPMPRWRGDEDISGKTLLLLAEQGFGDTINFCRYAALAIARGARVILEVQPPLISLMKTLDGVTVIAAGTPLPTSIDFYAPMLSLPLAFGTDAESIPAHIPYLTVNPERFADWGSRLSGIDAPHVGVVWSGNPAHRNDRHRSIPLEVLSTLFEVEDVDFISLQRDVRETDQKILSGLHNVTAWSGELRDFVDTAALVAALDLVITVDTAVAHLAGALGKPVWLLLPYVPDWRWLLERTDSPWYPSMRLFRQPRRGDWPAVIAEVAAAVEHLKIKS